jgi:uncharacterized protein DUF4258
MKKLAPLIVLAVVAVAVLIIRQCKHGSSASGDKQGSGQTQPGEVNRDRGFDRRVSYLQYSNHAKCRMECRHVTQEEVEETMRDGKINYKKSDLQNARCPRYALEDVTKENQHVRIVFAQCNNYTEVVTVIDLDTEWTCDCPGDDEKYQNRNR